MILVCFGTRPEWLKIKPVLSLLDKTEYKTLFTGQHVDLLKDIQFDYSIKVKTLNNRLNDIISSIMDQFPVGESVDSVLVQGDTATAFGCALAAFHKRYKIYYLESGLRTSDLDNPYPEEGYRQMIARIADVHFCPTLLSKENLLKENVLGKVFVTGNTVLDNLIDNTPSYTNKVLVTLHRRENHNIVDQWFQQLENLALNHKELEFVLPIHPNPEVQKHKHILKSVNIVEPLAHQDLVNLLKTTRLVITDSGGIQEEASFFNKRVIVCRKETERPEGIGTGHIVLAKSPQELSSVFYSVLNNFEINKECPYGDGHSGKRVVNVIRSRI